MFNCQSLQLEHLVWKLVCTQAILVSVQYSVRVNLSLFLMTKYTKKNKGNGGNDNITRILWIKMGRGLSAESEGWWNWIVWMGLASDLDMVSMQPPEFLCLGIDDFDKLWLEGGSAHEEAVNVLLWSELFAGTTSHRTWKEEQIYEQRLTQELKMRVHKLLSCHTDWPP